MARRKKPRRKSGGGVSLDIQGDAELLAALAKVAIGARTKVLRAGMRKGMDLVTAAAKARAPVRTGRLRDSLHTANGRTNSKWKVRVETKTTQGFFKGETFYAGIVEFGSKKMAARPFLTPAFDSEKARALAVARLAILEGIENEVWWASFRRTTIGRAVTRAQRRYRAAGRSLRKTVKSVSRTRKRLVKATRRVAKTGRRLGKAARRRLAMAEKGRARRRPAVARRARKTSGPPRRPRKRRR